VIVQRINVTVDLENVEKVIELLQAEHQIMLDQGVQPLAQRFYGGTPGGIGVYHTACCLECEFESLAEMEALWAEYYALETTATYMAKWHEYTSNCIVQILDVTTL
jgi:hypothetical protein